MDLRRLCCLIIGAVSLASCTSEPNQVTTNSDLATSTTSNDSTTSTTTSADGATGLLVELIGEVSGSVICPGNTQPCVTLDRDLGTGAMRVVVSFSKGAAFVQDARAVESPLANFVDRCEGTLPEADFEAVAALSPEEQAAAEEDGTYAYDLLGRYILTIPETYAVRWLSGTQRVHLGVVGDSAPHIEAMEELGLGQVVCVVGGFAHSDAELEQAQLAVGDMLEGWAPLNDGAGWGRDAFAGVVDVGMYEVDAAMIEESRDRFGDLVRLDGAFTVLNGSLDELHAQLELAGSGTADPLLRASCGAVAFPSLPPEFEDFPPLDEEAETIFDEFISGPMAVESSFLAEFEMRIAERSDNALVLLGRRGRDYADVRFEKRGDAWQATGWGGCNIAVSAPGFGSARTILDPAVEPDPDSTELHIAIQELACAGGQAPVDRDVVPVVIESETTIEITTLVAPVSGGATCPGNPWFPVVVTLDRPIADRTVMDMQSPPGVALTWPPGENDSD